MYKNKGCSSKKITLNCSKILKDFLALGIDTLVVLGMFGSVIWGCFKMGKMDIKDIVKMIILVIKNGNLFIKYIPINEALIVPK